MVLMLLPVFGLAQEGGIDARFHTLDEIYAQLTQWETEYPGLFHLDTIGYSTNTQLPILAAKISDNPHIREDKPRTLLIGQHHAEEILGNEIVLSVMRELLEEGMQSPRLRAFIQHMESWFIVTMNPEGLNVVMSGDDVTYRKNLTDNNNNGMFDFEPGIGMDIDGVDMNRNYDFTWIHGDSLYQGDYDYYRGPTAFSESENRAVARFALEQNFIYSFAYHSARSGTPEIIYYPWNYDNTGKTPPDFDAIQTFADIVANKILRQNGVDHYRLHAGTSRKGNAHNWFYAKANTIQLLIEVGTNNLQPDSANIEQIVERNKVGVYYMYDRTIGYNEDRHLLTGRITGAVSGEPLEAWVRVLEKDAPYLEQRKSDPETGRYWRPLMPGTYTIEVCKMGYQPVEREIVIGADDLTEDFALEPRPVHNMDFVFTEMNTGDTVNARIRLKYLFDAGRHHSQTYTTIFSTFQEGIELDEGLWRYEVEPLSLIWQYFPRIDTIDVRGDTTVNVLLPYAIEAFEDDFSDLSNWSDGGEWTVYTQRDGDAVAKSQSGRFYPNTSEQILTLNEPITLDGEAATLSLTSWHEIEWEHDSIAVEIRSDTDTTWTALRTFTGHPDSGGTYSMEEPVTHYMDLTPWMDQDVFLRFRLWSDSTIHDRGWHISHLKVETTSQYLSNEHERALPQKFIVEQNYPNPFNPATVIPFEIGGPGEVTLRIYNLLGQEVYRTVQSVQEPGRYQFRWNGTNQTGKQLSSGMYIGRIQWENKVEQRKLMLIR